MFNRLYACPSAGKGSCPLCPAARLNVKQSYKTRGEGRSIVRGYKATFQSLSWRSWARSASFMQPDGARQTAQTRPDSAQISCASINRLRWKLQPHGGSHKLPVPAQQSLSQCQKSCSRVSVSSWMTKEHAGSMGYLQAQG